MSKQSIKFKQILTVILLLLLVSCGTLNSFTRSKKSLKISPGMSAFIDSMDCNLTKCSSQKNLLHENLRKTLEDILNTNGINIVQSKKLAHFQFFLVTAHEQDIHYKLPRNVHLIIRDSGGDEILQIGISEVFSSPMTKEYISMSLISEKFRLKLTPHISTDYYPSLTKN